jgi:hypothetical protein|tara:strand:- start:670 stop:981 length:312 start_codon:yes stop_codon:yes gene_type:complete
MAKDEKMKQIAVLDGDGVLTGYAEVGLAEDGIEVPERDLAPGKYRWDGETFQPIRKPGEDKLSITIGAMAAALIAIRDDGSSALPQETLDFLLIWEKSDWLRK